MNCLRTLVHLSRRVNTVNSVQWQQCFRLMCSDDGNKFVIRSPGRVSMNSPKDRKNWNVDIDLDTQMTAIYEEEEQQRSQSILAPVEDESKVYAEPILHPTYNLAAYVQRSETLQKMIGIGISLYKLEKEGHSEFVANLDFERDIQPHILLLSKDIGVDPADLGIFFTKNITILKQNLDDIRTRVNYLQLKRFTKENIVYIITRDPIWLNFSTQQIDERLGHFQNTFKLTGHEVRLLTLAKPKLITSNLQIVNDATFTIREEFCFKNANDVKKMILKCPKLLMLDRYNLMDCYDYVSRVMKIDNDQLAMDPIILTKRIFRIKERHGFLKRIGKAQYNPKLPLYIPLHEMCSENDADFCEKIAKRPYEEFDSYLRTL